MLPLTDEDVESYNSQKFCQICKQKLYDVDNSSNSNDIKDSNDSNNNSNDKEFDLKKSHKNGDDEEFKPEKVFGKGFDDVGRDHYNVKEFHFMRIDDISKNY